MATERQATFPRGLGTDPRVDLNDLSKEEGGAWIGELTSHGGQVEVRPFEPVTTRALELLGGRGDSLL